MLREKQKVSKYMEKLMYWGFCAVVVIGCAYGVGWFLNWLTDDFNMMPYDDFED